MISLEEANADREDTWVISKILFESPGGEFFAECYEPDVDGSKIWWYAIFDGNGAGNPCLYPICGHSVEVLYFAADYLRQKQARYVVHSERLTPEASQRPPENTPGGGEKAGPDSGPRTS